MPTAATSIRTVTAAVPFSHELLHIRRTAQGMLIRQHQFPNTYNSKLDKIYSFDTDRVSYEHWRKCIKMVKGNSELQTWFQTTRPELVLELCLRLCKANRKTKWTGWRILASRNIGGDGSIIFHLQIFALHPESGTSVYSDNKAPNVGKSEIEKNLDYSGWGIIE